MEWVLLQIKDGATFLSPPPPPPPPLSLSSPPSHSAAFNLNNKVSPSMLLIIIILAVIFFVSGLLHLLVRFLLRPPSGRSHDETDDVTALQGQLQQLFHLHDAGVDQSFIDGLPVFNYKAIVGGAKKDPFDCAVCLCEFEGEDNLRLLPKCSHAFHMDCIDTWLLSHSTCPLCRASLLSEFSPNGHCSPIVLVLESGSGESSREIVSDNNNNIIHRVNSHLSCFSDEGFGFKADLPRKSGEIVVENEDEGDEREKVIEKVVYVKLGKFKNVDGGGEGGGGGGEGGSSEGNADARRCFSMGSFAYVMDEGSSLQVPIRTPIKKQSSSKKQCHRAAVSECGCDSRREFNGFEAFKILDIQSDGNVDNKSISGGSGRESFSVSKIWLRGKKDKGVVGGGVGDSSRRAFSFRFPLHRNVPVGGGKNGRSENGGSDDEEIESCNSLDFSQANSSSFGKGTLFWLMGRQNKIVHSSFSSNV